MRRARLVRFAVVLALVVAGAELPLSGQGAGQDPQFQEFTSRLAKKLSGNFVHRVAVPDCIGFTEDISGLDVAIADDLSDGLANANHKLRTYPRQDLQKLLSENGLDGKTMDTERGKEVFLKQTKDTDFILCHLQGLDNKLRIDVALYNRWEDFHGNKRAMIRDAVEIAFTPALEALASAPGAATPQPMAVLAAPSAQSPQIDSLVSQIAASLHAAGLHSVGVADCCWLPRDKADVRGNVGDAFRYALSKADPNFVVGHFYVSTKGLFAADEHAVWYDGGIRKKFLNRLKVDAAAVTELTPDGAGSLFKVTLYSRDGASLIQTSARIDNLEAFSPSIPPAQPTTEAEPDAVEAGKNGVASPECVYCPIAGPTQAALEHKTEGVIKLKLWIDGQGNVIRAEVLHGLPDGMTENALEKARLWKFKPAVDSEGKPVTVFDTFEMKFYRQKR
jgi:TonB family protein